MAPKFAQKPFMDIDCVSVNADLDLNAVSAKEAKLYGIIRGLAEAVDLLKAELASHVCRCEGTVVSGDMVRESVRELVGPSVEEIVKPMLEPFVKSTLSSVVNDVAKVQNDVYDLSANVQRDVCDLAERVNVNLLSVTKVEQYSRRGTLTVVGVSMTPGEDIPAKMCSLLSVGGIVVNPDDLEAAHRNGNKNIEFTAGNGVQGSKPPAITVRFRNFAKKDSVLRSYKNYTDGKAKPIRVYQSLTQYYKDLKASISKYCKDDLQLDLNWIHWRPSTAGMCVKTRSGVIYNKIFCFADFRKAVTVPPGNKSKAPK